MFTSTVGYFFLKGSSVVKGKKIAEFPVSDGEFVTKPVVLEGKPITPPRFFNPKPSSYLGFSTIYVASYDKKYKPVTLTDDSSKKNDNLNTGSDSEHGPKAPEKYSVHMDENVLFYQKVQKISLFTAVVGALEQLYICAPYFVEIETSKGVIVALVQIPLTTLTPALVLAFAAVSAFFLATAMVVFYKNQNSLDEASAQSAQSAPLLYRAAQEGGYTSKKSQVGEDVSPPACDEKLVEEENHGPSCSGPARQ